jgi:ubiquinol-cytochrome c reductase cytochrome b subunit
VPKKMNRIGAIGPAVKGFFIPVEKAEKPSEAPVSPPTRKEITSGRR